MGLTPKKLRKLAAKYSTLYGLEHKAYYRYQFGDESRKAWYMQGFGETGMSYLGDNAEEACEEMKRLIDLMRVDESAHQTD